MFKHTFKNQPWALPVVIAVLVIGLAFLAFGPRQKPGDSGTSPGPPKSGQVLGRPFNLLVVHTSDTFGYLEPCGCGGVPAEYGGLARRKTFISRAIAGQTGLVSKGGKVQRTGQLFAVIVDTGNLTPNPDKLPLILDGMKRMGYQAVGLGDLEISLGQRAAQAIHTYRGQMTFLDAAPQPGWENIVKPYFIYFIGDKRIVVTSISPDAGKPGLPSPARLEALKRALVEVHPQSSVVILLSQLGLEAERELTQLPEFASLMDVIIGGHPPGQLNEPEQRNGVVIVPTYRWGQMIGLLGVNFFSGRKMQLIQQLAPLDSSYPADSYVSEQVDQWYRERQMTGQAEELKRGRKAEECATCHAKQYDTWRASGHARAVQTLAEKQRLVSDCLPCHTKQGVTRNEDGTYGPGVDCFACHGEGKLHEDSQLRQYITMHKDEQFCRSCHDPANSPKFEFNAYLERIRHWD